MSSDLQRGVEARYCEAGADGSVTCTLCPHRCRLTEGRRGLCRSREVRDGRLVSLHFHPGEMCLSLAAAGCNLSCRNCQNWSISQVRPEEVESSFIVPGMLPELALRTSCRIVAYTYTEPLTWMEYTVDCARTCREAGLLNILVSAGYVNEGPLDDLLPYLDAANIDLKSFSEDIYRRVSRASLAPVLRTLEKMRDAGVWLLPGRRCIFRGSFRSTGCGRCRLRR